MPSREDAISGEEKVREHGRPHVRIQAPAKVNLILKILGRRADGFHDLWSLMQTVAVEDELTCSLHPGGGGVRLSVEGAALPTDDRNVVARAARLVLERARLDAGVEIRLRKVLPLGGGLGGGSSDAAATIVALNDLLHLGWTSEAMMELGAVVGSDVPFFFGAPTAIVEGRGERVKPIRLIGDRWILLVCPNFQVRTEWAFERLANSRAGVPPLPAEVVILKNKPALEWEEVVPLMDNDFEVALAPTHPAFREIKHELLSAGAEAALLSGSGSTVFGLFSTQAGADRARAAIGGKGYWTAAGRACSTPLGRVGGRAPVRFVVC